MADERQVTPASEWRKLHEEGQSGYKITLTSGFTVRLRPVSIEQMLKRGEIPDLLAPMAAQAVIAGIDGKDLSNTLQRASNTFLLIDFICELAFLEPRIVENPTADDEIGVSYLDSQDKFEVFEIVTQPGWVIRKFRDQQVADVAALHDGEGVQETAVGDVTGG